MAIGFRVQKLNRSQVQCVIPARPHNLNSQGEMEEAVVVSVAIQMAKLIVARWEIPIDWELDHIHFDRLQALQGELQARLEWEDLAREALRAELEKNSAALAECFVHVFDSQEKRVADVHVTLKIRQAQHLGRKESGGVHSK